MPPKKSWNADRIVSYSAIFVSVCALVVSIVQTRIMRSQQEKSVWPHVRWYTQSGWQLDSTGKFSIRVVNKGVGPAIIKKVTLVLDGAEYSADSMVIVGQKMVEETFVSINQSQFEQTVMLPNDEVNYFEVMEPKQAFRVAQHYASKIEGQNRFDIIIHYTDVYGNGFTSTGSTRL